MGQLELFLHDQPEHTPVLLKVALAHVQFETIHPFLDGNGRLGRLLITLLLCEQKVLKAPMLYLSLYFKTHRRRYYELLNEIRNTGDWEAWLEFFADAVIETATQAVDTVQRLLALVEEDRKRIQTLGRVFGSVRVVHQAMMERPIASPVWLKSKTGLSLTTIGTCLERLEGLGVVTELTGQKRNRFYGYTQYITIMNIGTEV
jgi:Fic family protein